MVGVTKASRSASRQAGLGKDLLELVNVRVSQINGCVACLSVHVPQAEKADVPKNKLGLLPAWREATVYSREERAALALAEDITLVAAPNSKRSKAARRALNCFTEEQVAALEWAIYTINTFNRISIYADHPPVGDWKSAE